ncbi:hypothetical protein MY10362_007513 [Beauveria mimosiformis]
METQVPSPAVSADDSAKTFSCLVCRQRKVRCDHAQPCSNCKRAKIDCEYVAPVRGKRKRSQPSRETMHAKLRRYEDMLRTRGVDVAEHTSTAPATCEDALSESNETTESPASPLLPTPGDDEAAPPMGFRYGLVKTPRSGPRLISKEGNSRYYETSTLWTDINDDFRHPDEFVPVDAGGQVTEAERNVAFHNASKLLEYASMVGENPSLRKFEWRLNSTYLWDKILFVLIEARRKRPGPDVDRVWELIGRVFWQYPDAFGQSSAKAVYKALSKWTLEVWDGHVAAKRAQGMPDPEEPA